MSATLDFGPSFRPSGERLDGLLERRDQLAKRVIPTGISYVDDCALGLHPTDLMILSAATGAGKTTAGLFVAAEAAQSGRRVHYLALEAFQDEIEARLLFREVAALASNERRWKPTLTFNRWMHALCSEYSGLEIRALESLKENCAGLNTLYRGSAFDHEQITRQFLAVREQTDLIVLDHLHFIDLDGPNENAELKKVIKAVRDAALDMEVPVIVIAHLRKKQGPRGNRGLPEIDDIHGSSDIAKAATKIVMLAPCPDISFGESEDNRRIATTAIQVLKDRYGGATNYVGLGGYDLAKMAYQPTYAVARLSPAGNMLYHLGQDELPHWAKLRGMGLKGDLGEGTKLA